MRVCGMCRMPERKRQESGFINQYILKIKAFKKKRQTKDFITFVV